MTRLETWAKEVAERYDILPGTVLEVYYGFEGRICHDGKKYTKRERAEKFFELYFEGRNNDERKAQVDSRADESDGATS